MIAREYKSSSDDSSDDESTLGKKHEHDNNENFQHYGEMKWCCSASHSKQQCYEWKNHQSWSDDDNDYSLLDLLVKPREKVEDDLEDEDNKSLPDLILKAMLPRVAMPESDDSDDESDDEKEGQEKAFLSKAADKVSEKDIQGRITKNTWIGDTGASCHMMNTDVSMYDVKKISSPVTVGDGRTMTATKIGKWKSTIVQVDGSTQDIILENAGCLY